MRKKPYCAILSFAAALPLLFSLSACSLLDRILDYAGRDRPEPETPPYTVKNPSSENGALQAEAADAMLTEFSMALVMKGLSGKAVRGVFLPGGGKSATPEEEKALLYGQDVLKKLLRTRLLYLSSASENELVTSVWKGKWVLSLRSGKETLLSCAKELSPSPSGK
ncbi:MAG: hypothetical protein J6331_01615 [Lentisphaeria bacterium]|nr:hypothetical protein [Lentisphaeria bacterium]